MKIQGDYELIKFKSENPKSKIVTNDAFLNWINGKEVFPELTKDDWKREKLERQEFGFREVILLPLEKITNLPKWKN